MAFSPSWGAEEWQARPRVMIFQRMTPLWATITSSSVGSATIARSGFACNKLELEEPFSDLDWYKTIIPVKIQRALDSLQEFVMMEDEFFLEDAYYTSLVVYKSLWKSLSGIRKIRNTIYVNKLVDEVENLLIEIIVEFKKEFPFEFIIGLLKANT